MFNSKLGETFPILHLIDLMMLLLCAWQGDMFVTRNPTAFQWAKWKGNQLGKVWDTTGSQFLAANIANIASLIVLTRDWKCEITEISKTHANVWPHKLQQTDFTY